MSASKANKPRAGVRRRTLLALALGLPALQWFTARAHTPYGQWTVYRQKHLLVGCHRENLATWSLAQSLVDVLKHHLPDARARVARAPHPERLASLLATDQLAFAILSPRVAEEMIAGRGRFNPYGPQSLKLIWHNNHFVLMAREDVPTRHGWLIADALSHSASDEATSEPQPDSGEPAVENMNNFSWHDGAALFQQGDPLPPG